MLGFCTAVIGRVRAAEQHAAQRADTGTDSTGSHQAAVVLASREQVIAARAAALYPVTRKSRTTYTGTGYRDGYAKGTQADIGNTRLITRARHSLR